MLSKNTLHLIRITESIDFSHYTIKLTQNNSLYNIGLKIQAAAMQVYQNGEAYQLEVSAFVDGKGRSRVRSTAGLAAACALPCPALPAAHVNKCSGLA